MTRFPVDLPHNLDIHTYQVSELVSRSLVQWGTMLWHEKLTQMEWGPEVVTFLTDRVRAGSKKNARVSCG